ncbi:MAG TPA: DUF302 domain-containing protein [Hanamia sp.]|jgi:uncharacterized protein (DUF302 family)|nr:DUF302 domain-containing protein [Hanamia sp.]
MEQLITIASYKPFKTTIERVVSLIKKEKLTIFAQIDHAAEAARNGLSLRPTMLILFGNPQMGTVLMQDQQGVGIDLPAKILVWEAVTGKTWMSYNLMGSLKAKHQLGEESNGTLRKIEKVVSGICKEASGPEP